jgi:hypothetical protein
MYNVRRLIYPEGWSVKRKIQAAIGASFHRLLGEAGG